jgi:hypothetical protein
MTRLARVGLIAPVVAFAIGYGWMYYQHRGYRQSAEETRQRMETELASSRNELRLARLQNHLASALLELERKNYGNAREASSKFFDEARAILAANPEQQTRARLEAILPQREPVMAAITETKPEAADLLRRIYSDLTGG